MASAVSAQAQVQQKPTNRALEPKPGILPDLVVVSIDFKDCQTFTDASGAKRGSIIPSVTYKNQGSVASGTFELAWEYFDYAASQWQLHLQSSYLTNSLGPGQSFTQGGQPVDGYIWTIGPQWPKFRCRLDVKSSVTESNETNNNMEKTFSPRSAAPSPGTPIIKK